MQVQILTFGVLKDWLGAVPFPVELREGATVGDLLMLLRARQTSKQFSGLLAGIAVSVNAEFATAAHVLHHDDEVGLLPPVSGGCGRREELEDESFILTTLTREPIQTEKLVATIKQGDDGAVVVFDGMVRNNTNGRLTLHLDYEAYEEMAAKQMNELAREARVRFAVRSVCIVHRLGRLQVGETSVLIIVASAHRAPAYEASRWLIDTLKKTVPIWKKEAFADGVVWASGEPFPEELSVNPAEVLHEAD